MPMQPPLTVLIVDDELPIRQDLRAYPWQDINAVWIGEAENGEEALEMCREHMPNVVIADITMPLMNGLDLLKAIRSEMPFIKVILLTCHTEFSYALEALRLGATEYLTKVPLEDTDIRMAIDKARTVIHSEQLFRKGELVQKRNMLAKTISKILNNSAAYSEESVLPSLPIRLIFLRLDTQATVKPYLIQEIYEALDKLEHLLSKLFLWTLIDGQFVFIGEAVHQDVRSIEDQLATLMYTLKQMLLPSMTIIQDGIQMYTIVSETVNSYEEIPKAFNNSSLWDKSKFYERNQTQIYIGKPIPLTPIDAKETTVLTRLFNLMAKEPGEENTILLSEFSIKCMRSRYEPEELKRLVHTLIQGFIPQNCSVAETIGLYEPILEANSLIELIGTINALLTDRSTSAKRGRKEIGDALAYILGHLDEDLALTTVSYKVGLSPSYFSKVFREQVGESYNDYITRKRVEKAEELLRDTNLKVYEIAERIGIPNYRYFTALFKEKTGLTPTDYKRG
ncbi:response regulator transcription factor [Paenibacillus sp. FSL H8-0034]|uniref:response regulator transcription factor n=1 Tax=Paenibacillus sp. FSL H8-0034 TaxID=2954671 RepID=UPI0030F6770F